ncbi:MAG: phloretin hydrolase [Clostridia bacterium]|nr:phloretin hydrolase [Clostridia bacterium]
MAKVPVSMVDKEKSYFKYYLRDMAAPPAAKLALIGDQPGNAADALRIQERNLLFEPGDLPGEFGWWQMPDGTALIANQTFFPNVSGEMFDWWFAWHPIDRLRYAIWDPQDHYDVRLQEPGRALDMRLTARERHWGSIHYIWEDIGSGGVDLLRIHFHRPAEFGYDESRMDSAACNALVCANTTVYGNEQRPDASVVMTHFLRPAEGGSLLRSRFWFGWQIIDGKPVKCIPDGTLIPPAGPIALLRHNVAEFTNLAAILPSVYAEEKDNWR